MRPYEGDSLAAQLQDSSVMDDNEVILWHQTKSTAAADFQKQSLNPEFLSLCNMFLLIK